MFEIVAGLGVLIDGKNIFKKIKGEKKKCVYVFGGRYVYVLCLDLRCV